MTTLVIFDINSTVKHLFCFDKACPISASDASALIATCQHAMWYGRYEYVAGNLESTKTLLGLEG